MSRKKKKLIQKARSLYNKISPCGAKRTFEECFTLSENTLFFWFDTEDHSTHILTEKIG